MHTFHQELPFYGFQVQEPRGEQYRSRVYPTSVLTWSPQTHELASTWTVSLLFSSFLQASLMRQQIWRTARASDPRLLMILVTRRGRRRTGAFRASTLPRLRYPLSPPGPRLLSRPSSPTHLRPARPPNPITTPVHPAFDFRPSRLLPSSLPLPRPPSSLSKRRGPRSSRTALRRRLSYATQSSTWFTRPSGKPRKRSTAIC